MKNIELGGWSFEYELFEFILETLPFGSTILELGSGNGTHCLSEHYKMYSIEHDIAFVNRYNSTYIYAPMRGHWYDLDYLNNLPKSYDMILIDGPIGSQSRNRIGFFENIGLFNTDVLLVLDDTNRAGERNLLNKVLKNVDSRRSMKDFKTFSVICPL